MGGNISTEGKAYDGGMANSALDVLAILTVLIHAESRVMESWNWRKLLSAGYSIARAIASRVVTGED